MSVVHMRLMCVLMTVVINFDRTTNGGMMTFG